MEREGPEIQNKLIKYAENKASYIEQFWYDSYLNFDNRTFAVIDNTNLYSCRTEPQPFVFLPVSL